MIRFSITLCVALFATTLLQAQVGVGTTTPNEDLHVVGNLQITDGIRLGGSSDADDTGSSMGSPGDVITTDGTKATWAPPSTPRGGVTNAYVKIGSTQRTINSGSTQDVPNLVQSITVPAGESRNLLITVTGYAIKTQAFREASQGAFEIYIESGGTNTKLSSAYTVSFNSPQGSGELIDLPAPVTFSTTTTVGPGTHIVRVRYKAWTQQQVVNVDAYDNLYVGATTSDREALKSRLTILEFAN